MNMVFTRKKRQSKRRPLSHLDDFGQDVNIGNAASERQKEITVVSEGINDRDFTVSTSSNNMAINGNTVNVKTLEKCFTEKLLTRK